MSFSYQFVAKMFHQGYQTYLISIQTFVLPSYCKLAKRIIQDKVFNTKSQEETLLRDLVFSGLQVFAKLCQMDQEKKFQSLFVFRLAQLSKECKLPPVPKQTFYNEKYIASSKSNISSRKKPQNTKQFFKQVCQMCRNQISQNKSGLPLMMNELGNIQFTESFYKMLAKSIIESKEKDCYFNAIDSLLQTGNVWNAIEVDSMLESMLASKKIETDKVLATSVFKFVSNTVELVPNRSYEGEEKQSFFAIIQKNYKLQRNSRKDVLEKYNQELKARQTRNKKYLAAFYQQQDQEQDAEQLKIQNSSNPLKTESIKQGQVNNFTLKLESKQPQQKKTNMIEDKLGEYYFLKREVAEGRRPKQQLIKTAKQLIKLQEFVFSDQNQNPESEQTQLQYLEFGEQWGQIDEILLKKDFALLLKGITPTQSQNQLYNKFNAKLSHKGKDLTKVQQAKKAEDLQREKKRVEEELRKNNQIKASKEKEVSNKEEQKKKKQAEQKRIAQEKRVSQEKEKKTLAEKKMAQQKKLAEERKIAERKLAEERKIAEQRKMAQERKIAEEKKLAQEKKKLAQDKKIAQQKKLAQEKKTAEEKKTAQQKRISQSKKIDQKKNSQKNLIQQKRLADQKRLAQQRRQAEQRRAKEQKKALQQKKRAEQYNQLEQRKLAEQRKAAELKKQAERQAEQKRMAQQRSKAEQMRLAKQRLSSSKIQSNLKRQTQSQVEQYNMYKPQYNAFKQVLPEQQYNVQYKKKQEQEHKAVPKIDIQKSNVAKFDPRKYVIPEQNKPVAYNPNPYKPTALAYRASKVEEPASKPEEKPVIQQPLEKKERKQQIAVEQMQHSPRENLNSQKKVFKNEEPKKQFQRSNVVLDDQQSLLEIPEIQIDLESKIMQPQAPSTFKECISSKNYLINTKRLRATEFEPQQSKFKLEEDMASLGPIIKTSLLSQQPSKIREKLVDQKTRVNDINKLVVERQQSHRKEIDSIKKYYEKQAEFLRKRIQLLEDQGKASKVSYNYPENKEIKVLLHEKEELRHQLNFLNNQNKTLKQVAVQPAVYKSISTTNVSPLMAMPDCERQLSQTPLVVIRQQPQRTKKAMLKNKELLFKNDEIEVGVISSACEEGLQMSLYFLAYGVVEGFTVEVKSPNLKHKISASAMAVKEVLTARQQKMIVIFSRPDTIPFELPTLSLGYLSEQAKKRVSVVLPCSINRFVEFSQVEPAAFYKGLEGKHSVQTKLDYFQKKLLKDPLQLRTLLPKMVLLNEHEYQLMLLQKNTLKYASQVHFKGKFQGYLVAEVFAGNRMKFKFYEDQQCDRKLVDTLLHTLRDLFWR